MRSQDYRIYEVLRSRAQWVVDNRATTTVDGTAFGEDWKVIADPFGMQVGEKTVIIDVQGTDVGQVPDDSSASPTKLNSDYLGGDAETEVMVVVYGEKGSRETAAAEVSARKRVHALVSHLVGRLGEPYGRPRNAGGDRPRERVAGEDAPDMFIRVLSKTGIELDQAGQEAAQFYAQGIAVRVRWSADRYGQPVDGD